jgi:hypothetical protein
MIAEGLVHRSNAAGKPLEFLDVVDAEARGIAVDRGEGDRPGAGEPDRAVTLERLEGLIGVDGDLWQFLRDCVLRNGMAGVDRRFRDRVSMRAESEIPFDPLGQFFAISASSAASPSATIAAAQITAPLKRA